MPKYSEYTDCQLVRLLNNNDYDSFTAIYDRYWNILLAIAYNHTHDKSAAKEIVQELFISLWNRKGRTEIKNLNAYLSTAIKFSVFRFYHREGKRAKNLKKIVMDESYSMDEAVSTKFLEEYINDIIEQLPEKCRLVFKYSRRHDMKISEISSEMGIAEKTVEAHLTKALKVLRVAISQARMLAILLCIMLGT